jgi:hypothetical protein
LSPGALSYPKAPIPGHIDNDAQEGPSDSPGRADRRDFNAADDAMLRTELGSAHFRALIEKVRPRLSDHAASANPVRLILRP